MSAESNIDKRNPTEVFPRGWNKAKVRDLVELVNGYAFKPSDWSTEGLPIIRIQNLNTSTASYNYCSRALPSKFSVDTGDLLFAWSGTPGTSFGAHIWKGTKAWLNQHIFKVVFDENNLNKRFVRLAINQNLNEYIAAAHGGAGLAHITKGKFEESELHIPPLGEQKRIVAEVEKQFTRLDAAVDALKRVRTKLKRYRATILKAACEGRLVLNESELARLEDRDYEAADVLLQRILKERRAKWEASKLGKIEAKAERPERDNWKAKYREPLATNTWDHDKLPEGWCWATADQCTTMITDGEHITPERAAKGVLLLSARNVRDGKLSLDNVDFVPEPVYERIAKRLVIVPGDVLLSCSGSVGRSCVAPQNLKFTLVRSVAVLKPVLQMGHYLSAALRSPILQAQITDKKTQTAQSNIFQGKIKSLMFPLPPLAEQQRIVDELERRLSVIEELEALVEANLKRAGRLRQSILRRAFEGKLVPQDPNDEPAVALIDRIRAERYTKAGKK